MAKLTTIPWCDHTWNPWEGCTKWSPGCVNCYAENRNIRLSGGANWGPGAPRRRTSENNWKAPLRWNRDEPVTRPRVFSASLADWLDDEVPIEWLADFLSLIYNTQNLDWLLLTKRPENFRERVAACIDCTPNVRRMWLKDWLDGGTMPPNVWIGTTVEDQTRTDERIPVLLSIPARVRFLSCEPLLEAVNLDLGHIGKPGSVYSRKDDLTSGLDWVIAGCESGPRRRPMVESWARSLATQCQTAGVAFFMKQMVISGELTENLTDFPEALQIRQFPEVRP